MALLTNTELDFLLGKREFTKPQKRYLKCRLSKKVNDFVNNELLLLQKKGYLLLPLSSVAASCNGNSDNGSRIAACRNAELTNSNKNGAGSGNSVPPSPHPQRGREGNISNPRVLSDMGLAIPRPTRLGDPRSVETETEPNSVSVCASLSSLNIILTSLSFLLVLLLLALQP